MVRPIPMHDVHPSYENFVRCLTLVIAFACGSIAYAQQSVARQWNEELLEAIRNDFARPTVHARNLFHTSVATWDAFAAYDPMHRYYLARAGDPTDLPYQYDVVKRLNST